MIIVWENSKFPNTEMPYYGIGYAQGVMSTQSANNQTLLWYTISLTPTGMHL